MGLDKQNRDAVVDRRISQIYDVDRATSLCLSVVVQHPFGLCNYPLRCLGDVDTEQNTYNEVYGLDYWSINYFLNQQFFGNKLNARPFVTELQEDM
jgi:hypothetical protein